MSSPLFDRALEVLKFDDSLLKRTYPSGSHSITFPSKTRTKLMEDADHNPRKVGSVVRFITRMYYFEGGFGGKGSSVGRGRVDQKQRMKEKVHGMSPERKKELRIKAQMKGELSSVLERFKKETETKIGADDSRLQMINLERADALRKYEEQESKGITLERKK